MTAIPPGLPLAPPPPAHTAPLPPERPGPGGTRLRTGVPYAAMPGVRPLELDLYLPPGGTPGEATVPVVVFLHGGGWRMGSRHTVGPAFADWSPTPFERLAQAGIAVASVDYRLSGEAVWPAQLHDVKAAVRWLRARAGELGIDPDRVAAWGESAGGHLAALLGLTAEDPALEGDVGLSGPSSAVVAVAAWYPPTDLAGLARDAGTDPADPASREALLLGAPPATVPERAAQASPLTHASPAAPPMLLLHGRADQWVPCAQSRRLAAALEAAGAAVELQTFEGADHMWLGTGGAAAAIAAHDRTVTFLRQQLRTRGAP